MTDYQRSNFRFLAGAVSVISAMALAFTMLAWLLGGTPYFKEVLLGETLSPVLGALIVLGAVTVLLLRERKTALAA